MCNPFDNFRNKIVFYGNDFNTCEYVCPTKDEVIDFIKNDWRWSVIFFCFETFCHIHQPNSYV